MTNTQQFVHSAVVARGYHKDWLEREFVVRQILKLSEELVEVLSGITLLRQEMLHLDVRSKIEPIWMESIRDTGELCRKMFDVDRSAWDLVKIELDLDTLRDELADMQVVIYALAEEINLMDSSHPYDVETAAREKSIDDIPRGIRA
jgi:NTP pyrophosphatase (non-canonical NTP hydrolase)